MTAPLLGNYHRYAITFDHGDGAWLVAEDGRRYLDFGAGIAVTALGHCHPHLVAALTGQANKLWHCSNLYPIPEQERLAARLVAASFADRAFFCNSGAEAIEGGLKMIRRYHHARGGGDRWRVICFEGAFHGRTLATIAANGAAKYRDGFGPDVPGFDHVPFGDIDAVRAALTDETAAILVEPIQGEGGIRVAPEGFLEALAALCDAHGLLLFFDEVQCGVGRAGALFAHQHTAARPDLMALAKGLGGGFPIGALLASERVADAMTPGSHGTTFGGNPLACAVANAVLDVVLADGFLAGVTTRGHQLRAGLEALAGRHPGVIASVRGRGLMLGLECRVANADMIAALHARGLLAVPAADNVVRLLPPLIVSAADVDHALDMLGASCAHLAEKAA